jgi:hypothetical protein
VGIVLPVLVHRHAELLHLLHQHRLHEEVLIPQAPDIRPIACTSSASASKV